MIDPSIGSKPVTFELSIGIAELFIALYVGSTCTSQ